MAARKGSLGFTNTTITRAQLRPAPTRTDAQLLADAHKALPASSRAALTAAAALATHRKARTTTR